MNLTRTITFIFGMISTIHSTAQQDPRSSFFWNNYMHTNPAMTGAIYKHHANAQWRNQWTKINGAPTTLWLNYAARLDSINSGIGVSYEYDVIGRNRQHTGLVSYAYHIPVKNFFISIGTSLGVLTSKMDTSDVVTYLPMDPDFGKRRNFFQADLGIAFHGEKWNAGLSCVQFSGFFIRNSTSSYDLTPHYWLFGDYSFNLGQNWKLTPRAQVGSDLLKYYSIVALIASWKNLWFGATAANPFSNNGFELGPMIGYDIAGKFRLGYTYEFGINTTLGSIKNNATHEIILSYQLK
jgi:type IX secretion system PorP/SprF family membrane protein